MTEREVIPLRRPVQASRGPFALRLAVVFVLVAVTGFSTTFWLPLVRGTFGGRALFVVHGAFAFAWVLLFVVQAALVRVRRIAAHRTAGWAGAVVAAGLVLTGIAAGVAATRRDVAADPAGEAYGNFVNIVIELLLFGVLVAAAVVRRRDREVHRRLLFVATISLLGPAWFRFRHLFPMVPYPLVTWSLVADALLLAVALHDRRTLGRVHRTTWRVGGAVFAVHLAELVLIRTGPWRALGRALMGDGG